MEMTTYTHTNCIIITIVLTFVITISHFNLLHRHQIYIFIHEKIGQNNTIFIYSKNKIPHEQISLYLE